jgi:S-layer glycoprotein
MARNQFVFITLAGIVCFFLLVVPVLGSDIITSISGSGSVGQGRPFTLTVIGIPNTQYYVWVTGTFSMTGATGDQPPVVQSGIEGVAQDPAGGPYTIGSYAFQNGNGRTIQQDVALSTTQVPNTRYYARVTTDNAGRAFIGFQTSSATAPKTFSIRIENADSYDEESIIVEKGSVSIEASTERTVQPTPVITLSTPETSIPMTQGNSVTPLTTATTTPKPALLETEFILLGAGFGLFCLRKT